MLLVLYILTQRTTEHAKTAKRFHAYKGYTSTYNVDILTLIMNCNLKILNLQLKKKTNNRSLLELRVFKFATTLSLVFKKIKVMMKQSVVPFVRTQKQKKILIKVILLMYLNQFIFQFYETYKNFMEKCRAG